MNRESIERSQESLQNVVKLIITLAISVLALSGTFASKMSGGVGFYIILLYISWFFLIMTIFKGIGMLSSLAQLIMNGTSNWWEQTISRARSSWRCFQIGIVLLVVYGAIFAGFRAFNLNSENGENVKTIKLANEKIKVIIAEKDTINLNVNNNQECLETKMEENSEDTNVISQKEN